MSVLVLNYFSDDFKSFTFIFCSFSSSFRSQNLIFSSYSTLSLLSPSSWPHFARWVCHFVSLSLKAKLGRAALRLPLQVLTDFLKESESEDVSIDDQGMKKVTVDVCSGGVSL